jgi:hypothetical protein
MQALIMLRLDVIRRAAFRNPGVLRKAGRLVAKPRHWLPKIDPSFVVATCAGIATAWWFNRRHRLRRLARQTAT